jgi:hypothetical protein
MKNKDKIKMICQLNKQKFKDYYMKDKNKIHGSKGHTKLIGQGEFDETLE